uniref:Uncharacterized protein n=1 Tax=Setaria viridis TaxID=4556 RepID=A0A4U6U2Y5_SETVI|nr:hypothetical protein SEVIR_7G340050v2 [Setaria viridis]
MSRSCCLSLPLQYDAKQAPGVVLNHEMRIFPVRNLGIAGFHRETPYHWSLHQPGGQLCRGAAKTGTGWLSCVHSQEMPCMKSRGSSHCDQLR